MVIQSPPAPSIPLKADIQGEMAGVCTEILQGPFSTFSLRDFIQRGAAEAKKYLRCAF